MKQGLTHFTLVLDRSGSMMSIKQATILGFNEFILAQKQAPGEATMYAVKFDTEYEVIYEGPMAGMPLLDSTNYEPRANTALHDAIGNAIIHTAKYLGDKPESERAEKVIFAIMTDGMENASRQYHHDAIANMIQLQKDVYKWEFVYLGANQDAVMVGAQLNIPKTHSVTYAAKDITTQSVVRSMAVNAVSYRSGQAVGMAFTDEQRLKAVDEKLPQITK